MKFLINGAEVDVDVADLRVAELFSSVTVQELVVIKKHSGLGLATLSEAMKKLEPEAVLMLVWVGLKRLGHHLTPEQLDFDLLEFCTQLAVTQAGGVPDNPAGAESPEDPTRPSDSSPSGRTPTPADSVTWPPSPTT